LFDLFALAFEVMGTIVFETMAWFARLLFGPSRRPAGPDPAAATAREPRALPEGTVPRIVAALGAGEDAAVLLPNGWRGFHSSIVDAASPKPADAVPVGTELLLVPRPDPVGEMASYAVVAPLQGSTVTLGTLTNQKLDRSIRLGRVRCWLTGRRPTLRSASAAALFIAVYDP
jgi:hypothetical protein